MTGWEWLASSDACPMCLRIAKDAKAVRLGEPFAVIGDNPHYSRIQFPPAHPHCNCTMVEVLDTDPQPDWKPTLNQPEPLTDDEAAAEIERIREQEDAINPVIREPEPPKPKPSKLPRRRRLVPVGEES